MMKKKMMIAGFWLLLLCPNLIAPFTKGNEDGGNAEKRELAQFPSFSFDTLSQYPKAMDSYINDHAALRSSFLGFNASLNLTLFNHADTTEALKGRDGWYFFTGGSSVADCLGTNRFSGEDLAYINSCVQKTADYFRSQGIEFLVVLPPNKEDIYREYMPDGYERVSEVIKGEELSAYLQANSGVKVVDPRDYFKNNKDYLWYFKTDTHWNDAAGFAVSQMIIEALGGTATAVEDVTITYVPEKLGDLANLFYLPETMGSDLGALVSGYLTSVQVAATDVSGNGSIVHYETKHAPDERRIAFYRDSFGTAIASILPKYFKSSDFYHWQSFDASLLEANKPDVVIYEITEREQGRIPDDMRALAPAAFTE